MPDKRYFYVPVNVRQGEVFSISGDRYNHIVNVLRKKQGDSLHIVDGNGFIILSQILFQDKESIRCRAEAVYRSKTELPVYVTLAVGLIKRQRYEWMVEKAAELGVSKIQPLETEHVVRSGFRKDRLEKKVIAAMQQSERAVLPGVNSPVSLKDYLSQVDKDYTFVATQREKSKSLVDLLSKRNYDKIIILIGPEGGWSDSEYVEFSRHNLQQINLGNRRLRTETAALAAMSQIALITGGNQ